MALCVRRLRGAPGMGRSGVRGARVAAGILRDGNRVRDVILFRELRPCPGISAAVRRPPTAIVLSPRGKPLGIRLSSPSSEQIKDIIIQNKLPPKSLSQFLHHAEPSDRYPSDRECSHLSSAQLDCFRSLFEPGVCRTPYQALAFPTMAAQQGLLNFTLSAKTAGGQATSRDEPSMEEQLAVMHEKLREELPKFLRKPPNVSLYSRDMEFISTIFHLHFRGLAKYQLFLTFTRFLLLFYYNNSHISVLKLTTHPETSSIHARWSFTGIPLHYLFLYVFKRDKTDLYSTYDAFSIFQLGPDGRICLHKLERVMPSTPLTVSKKTILAAALLAVGLGDERPALNLLSTSKLPDKE